ncbi:restriction endonuclease subunit S [Mesorhizobium sp. ISC15]|uniref:restriction endonuclease subunit S n=1 Tax=Mesorhizobium sp. ISC15 TaxID=3076429 RepID=UPI00301C3A2F
MLSDVGDVAEIFDSRRIPLNSEQRRTRQGPYPYWGANGILDYVDDFLFDEPLVLMAEDGGYFDKAASRPICHRLDGRAWVNNHAHIIKPLKADRDYFYYWFVHRDITPFIKGGTRAKLNQADLKRLPIALPPLDEQRRIADVLRSVDAAIAAAADVSALAATTFDALIADIFRRYHHERAVFRSLCVPNGLQTGPFGSQLKASDYIEDGIPVIMPVDLRAEGIDFGTAKATSLEKCDQLKRHVLRPGDVLFARRGEIGRCGLYLENDPIALCGTGCLRARLDNSKMDPVLAYFLIQSQQARSWLCDHAVGATMPNLSTSIIGDLPLPSIPTGDQQKWIDALLMVEGVRRVNQRSLNDLTRSKVHILNDLLSGRVRAPE